MTMGYLLLSQKLKLGMKMIEFSDEVFLDLDARGTKHVLSADRLFLYERSSPSWRV
jgi:hypothetical protein